MRQAFIAKPGCLLVAADYSQVELRIMAHLSEDPSLLEAFNAGQDIHRATAAEVFGVEPEAVTTDQRRSAKAINFGLIYGMSAFGLARQLGINRKQAAEYIELYFARYPGVQNYMNNIRTPPPRMVMWKPSLADDSICQKLIPEMVCAVRPQSAPRSTRRCRAQPQILLSGQ